ncbi:MAG: hypothetical protein ABUS57_02840 [Pseudomonadota bacterium]
MSKPNATQQAMAKVIKSGRAQALHKETGKTGRQRFDRASSLDTHIPFMFLLISNFNCL